MLTKPTCNCRCHQKVAPEFMNKWALVKEIEKYGKLKYATNRSRDELIEILYDLNNPNSTVKVIDGVIYLKPEKIGEDGS